MLVTRLIRLLTILATAGAADAVADVVPWLYDIEVPVSSQSAVERQRAARTALAQLLTRLTGLRELPPHPAVSDALRLPTQFYSRFEFAERPLTQVDDDAEATREAAETVLVVSFDPVSVLDLLRDAELPIWAADRPTILLWLALEDHGERSIASVTATPELAAALAERARKRGLQVTLPLMDLQDMHLSPTDILGGFLEAIHAASARYAPDMLLVGRASKGSDGRWRSDWQLQTWRTARPVDLYIGAGANMIPGGVAFDERFDHQAETAWAAAHEALDSAADTLAARFAVRGDLHAIAVTVSGGQTVRGYASLLRYLNSREYIERVEVAAVRPDAVLLRLHSRSSVDQLRELLPMGGSMRAAPATGGTLGFSWTGAK